MIPYLMLTVSSIYGLIAIEYYLNGQFGLSTSFFLYGLANMALYASGRGW